MMSNRVPGDPENRRAGKFSLFTIVVKAMQFSDAGWSIERVFM